MAQLIRAAGRLPAAADTLQPGNGVLGLHPLDQAGDPLEVAMAATGKLYGLDDVPIQLQIDAAGAYALRRIRICHFRFFPSIKESFLPQSAAYREKL